MGEVSIKCALGVHKLAGRCVWTGLVVTAVSGSKWSTLMWCTFDKTTVSLAPGCSPE